MIVTCDAKVLARFETGALSFLYDENADECGDVKKVLAYEISADGSISFRELQIAKKRGIKRADSGTDMFYNRTRLTGTIPGFAADADLGKSANLGTILSAINSTSAGDLAMQIAEKRQLVTTL